MKKLIFILFLLPLLTFGQNRFPSIDSAKNYVLRYVKNSAVESFTNLRMQNVTYGTLQLLDSLCGSGVIDTIWKSGDTLKYRIGSQTVTVGVFQNGGSTDTTSLSNRINLKLNISDTANMLLPYLLSNVAAATYQPIGDYLVSGTHGSLQSLTITGTSGNGNIHLRHQSSLPTATGQSTTIYANSNGDFAYKNDGNYHTTFVTSGNTADRSYTFQNKDYTVADNAEVVKYTDTSSMLDGRISSITLNTSGAIHTNPITFNRVGGAWSGTMSLSNQSPFTIFRRASGTGTPTFGSIDSSYFASDFYNQVTNAYDPITAAGSGLSLVCDFISPSWPQASGAAFYINEGMGLFAQVSGTGATVAKFIEAPYEGITLNTGTTNAGYSRFGQVQGAAATATANPIFLLSTDTLFVEALVRIPTLSDGTETFAAWIGSVDRSSGSSSAPNNAISFLYYTASPGSGIASSANWQTGTATGGVRTYTTTSTAVVANTWTKLQMKAITGRVEFFVNGVSVATHTTNIPSGIMLSGELYKSAGTTSRTMNIDYIVVKRIYSTKK